MRPEIRLICEALQIAAATELAPDGRNQDYPNPTLDARLSRGFEFLCEDEVNGVGRVRTNQADPGHALVNRDSEPSVAHGRAAVRLIERSTAVAWRCFVETVGAWCVVCTMHF
jgi:hypothetical protein